MYSQNTSILSKMLSADQNISLTENMFKQIFLISIYSETELDIFTNVMSNKTELYFKIWIECGLRYLSLLRFIDGQLDVQCVYATVRNKTNIFSEIAKFKKSLVGHKGITENHEPDNYHSDSIYVCIQMP